MKNLFARGLQKIWQSFRLYYRGLTSIVTRGSIAAVFLLAVLSVAPVPVRAFSMSQPSYLIDTPLLIQNTVSNLGYYLYRPNDSEDALADCGSLVGQDFTDYSNDLRFHCGILNVLDEYAVVEYVNHPEESCSQPSRKSYAACRAHATFVSEVRFEIKRILEAASSFSTSIIAHRPEAVIDFPREGDFIGATTTIRYTAFDADTVAYPPFGFGEKPISIYYSDVRDPVESGWLRIVENQPSTGEFAWDSSFLQDGSYWLRMVAQDEGADRDEDIVGPFALDTIPPVFAVLVEPPVSKGEKVKIIVEAPEPLGAAPVVIVRQRDFTDIEVAMRGEGMKWEGMYEVRPSFDGTARVRVSGKDRAGNESSRLRSGGTFSVGINPPPPPVVIRPLNNDIFATSSVLVEGAVREDTKAVVFLNDEKIGTFAPDTAGNFGVVVTLSERMSRGINFIKVISEDEAGNTSDPVILALMLNQAPELVMVEPSAGAITQGTTTISLQSRDANKDRLLFAYEISADGGATWHVLAAQTPRSEIAWDTTAFADGEYRLRVRANDGTAEVVAEAAVTVQNFLPVVAFSDGARTVTNSRDVVIGGEVKSPEVLGIKRFAIRAIEYRIGAGAWISVPAADGVLNGADEGFRIALAGRDEGRYRIEVRAGDSRGLYGYATKELIVDFGPPPVPVVVLPANGAVLVDADDADKERAGVQFVLSGTAEPKSTVRVSIAEKTFSGVAADNGAFRIEDVTLREHGANTVLIFTEDAAGNKSERAMLTYIYNNPPRILFLAPRDGEGLNHTAEISWDVRDPDGDAVKSVVLRYRKGVGAFNTLARNSAGQKFVWDVGTLPQGADYQLKLEAGDGASIAEEIIGIFIDHAAPTIAVMPFRETAFAKKFTLRAEGSAFDDFSGVQFVEYAVSRRGMPDGALRWYKAVITRGFRERDAAFRFAHPFALEDGEYEVDIRSVDVAGNVSEMFNQAIMVDTTPPRIGSYTLTKGALMLLPEGEGFRVSEGADAAFKLSLETDTKEVQLAIGGVTSELRKNPTTNLWEAILNFKSIGEFPMLVSAVDALGNTARDTAIGVVAVAPRGRIAAATKEGALSDPLEGVGVWVLVLNEDTQSFAPWHAEEYGAVNPVLTGAEGEYDLLLPPGKFQLLLQKRGFGRARTEPFTIHAPRFMTADFAMEPRQGVRGFIEDVLERFMGM